LSATQCNGKLTPVNKFYRKQSFFLSKFSETFISRLMGKEEKNTIAAKAKKPLNAITSPELLAKPVSSSVTPLKQEQDKPETDFYSKPIFRSRRFDLF
jgi:hypothetical protein